MNKFFSLLKKFKISHFNISLTIWLSIWYFLTCIILIIAQNYLFYTFIFSYYNQTEKQNIQKTIQKILLMMDDIEIHHSSHFNPILSEQNESIYFLVKNLQNQKIIFISPGMYKFLYSLREEQSEKLVTPEDNVKFIEKNSKYFYYIKREVIHNNKYLYIEILADKTNKISILEKFKNKSTLIYFMILMSCLFLSILISKAILSPIHRLVKQIKSITSLNLHERVNINWLPQEIKIIKNSFNEVLERLEDSFLRVSQFSDDIAHEIRTPVNNLKGEIEVALQNKRAPNEYIDILYSNLEECNRLTRIIDNLTFLSRSEKNNIHIHPEELNIYQELLNIKDLYDGIAEERSIKILVHCNKDLNSFLDRILFQRIISNLISNAITYNKQDGNVLLSAKLTENHLVIDVTDTGVGIPEKSIPHLFDRFYRIEKSRHSSSKNLGLGLSMVKSMVGLHKGTIEIKSKEGVGTSVYIKFPRRNLITIL